MAPTKPTKQKPTPKTVADFTILPLTLPNLPHLPEQYQNAQHFIYVKPHKPSTRSATDDQSLFIANTPIDATENSIRRLFQEQLGGSMVERVEFDATVPAAALHKRWKPDGTAMKKGGENRGKKRKRSEEALVAEGVVEDEDSALPAIWPCALERSGSGAVVVFVDKKSAQGAMKAVNQAVREGKVVEWKKSDAVVGVQRYKSHLNLLHPTPTVLQTSINAYLTQFSALETLRNKMRKTSRTLPDEDGFITVTRGGRAGPARIEQAEAKQKELEERRKKNGAKDDFYRFQNRERRKEVEMGLRRRFEEDRKRVQKMREGRRVRPES